uniref:hypothetical protein n=1 Tax=Paractinoplanes polyasparticus TaxID=2856853 RepID=UPI001C849CBF|nr:hypothetical protein [Actinoplanes polyasparticus]
MTDDQDLLDRFKTAEGPVSRVTVETAVAAGRRRTARRRAARAGCGAVLVAGAALAVPALLPDASDGPAVTSGTGRTSCAANRLPAPPGLTNVWAVTVDPTGRYIAGYAVTGNLDIDPVTRKFTGTAPSRPVLWTDGQATTLPAPLRAVEPTGVNADGVVVAVAGDQKRFDSVLRYVDGVPEKAVLPAGQWEVHPYAKINARGDILITVVPAGKPDSEGVVLLWKAGSRTAKRMPLPVGADGKALTDSGAVVGDRLGSRGDQLSAYLWDERGNGRKLPTPHGQQGSVNTGRGDWAVGNVWPSGTVIRWNLSTGETTPIELHAPAHAINSHGWIVTDGTLMRDDVTVELSPVAPGEVGLPVDVADNGTVVGSIPAESEDRLTTVSRGPVSWPCGPK